MRTLAGFTFVSVMSLHIASVCFVPREKCELADTPTSTEELCRVEADTSAPFVSIDDRLMKAHITREGGKLVDEGQATKMNALIKQLGLKSCQVDLIEPTTRFEDTAALYEQSRKGVLLVSAIYKCDRCDNWHATGATGFVIGADGIVVTNYHVVDQPEKSTLVVMTGEGDVMPVKRVLAANEKDDVAILKVEGEGLHPLPIARQAAPVASPISVISHPDEHYFSYTQGVVSRYMKIRSRKATIDTMTITADFAKGSSGAPVLNEQGEVVGIVRSTESIYYHDDHGEQKNLQMVFKTCVPATQLLALIENGQGNASEK